jgi:hypothetical protein
LTRADPLFVAVDEVGGVVVTPEGVVGSPEEDVEDEEEEEGRT